MEIKELKEMDLSIFEGKEVLWSSAGITYNGIVANFDYDIGLTIVIADEREVNLICLHGPGVIKESEYREDVYDNMLIASIEMIKDGFYDCSITDKIYYTEDIYYGDMINCAFSQ